MNWNFNLPVEIIFGEGKATKELGAILAERGLENGLLVSDPIFMSNGVAEQICAASDGRVTGIFSELVPNPTCENIDACARLIREKGYGFVVSLGGGSSLDCGKAASSLCKTQDSIREYMYGRKKFGPEHLPLIAIPTTAGTGSEVTRVAVVTDPESNQKLPINTPNFFAKAAIIDPLLTLTIPPRVTASCGLDVISQSLEGYWSKEHQPICDACAVQAVALALQYLKRACDDGSDREAREGMCRASLLGGVAFFLPKTSGPHVCSYPLTSVYHVPHGEACALTLDSFLRLNADADGGRLHTFAHQLGMRDAFALADAILQLKKDCGLRTKLSEVGVTAEQIPSLVEACHHPNMNLNPVEVTDTFLEEMFNELM